jgi:DNA-binding NarL/FixJ family response regulator
VDGDVVVRVLLVDDHPVVRTGLRALLGTYDDLEVVGEAVDGEQAVRECVVLRPDVVLMDVRMPGPDGAGTDGVEATRRIRAAAPGTAVLIMTMYDDDETVLTAMRAGARGYLLKGAAQDEIVGAVRAVAAGQAVFGPSVAGRMLELFARPEAARPFDGLTAREHEVLELLATGRRTVQIARELHLSPKTVSNHLTSIFAKLQVSDRAGAIIRARDEGLGRAGPGSR